MFALSARQPARGFAIVDLSRIRRTLVQCADFFHPSKDAKRSLAAEEETLGCVYRSARHYEM